MIISSEFDYLDRDDGREHVDGVCADCGEACQSITIDNGIGEYEYWGARGRDVRLEEVSPCCWAEVIDPPTCPHCDGTGDTGQVNLDCVFCDAAERKAATINITSPRKG